MSKKRVLWIGCVLVILIVWIWLGERSEKPVEITYYAAKSLNEVSEELISKFHESHPEILVRGSYDSSGTLMEGILNGHAVDVFFSASGTQMKKLSEAGLVVEKSHYDLLNNQVCVVTYKGSNTTVTGLLDLAKAKSIALADGSVPVGKYTREALVAAGLLDSTEDNAKISTEEISKALGNVTINACGNVGAVATAVMEGANEVGIVYYSDVYGREDKLEILEKVSYELTGNVIYPVARIENPKASEEQRKAAETFLEFLRSREAKEIFTAYHFDVIE